MSSPSVAGGSDMGTGVGRTVHGKTGIPAGHHPGPSCPPSSSTYPTSFRLDVLGQLLDLLVHGSPLRHELLDALDAVQGGRMIAVEQLADLDQRERRELAQ